MKSFCYFSVGGSVADLIERQAGNRKVVGFGSTPDVAARRWLMRKTYFISGLFFLKVTFFGYVHQVLRHFLSWGQEVYPPW